MKMPASQNDCGVPSESRVGVRGWGGVEEHRKHTSWIAASGFYEVIHLDLTVLSGRYTRPTPELGTIVNTL